MKVLVVAAWEPELTRFREIASGTPDIAVDAIGAGVVDAAVGTAHAIARHRPTHAVLIGTCGALARDLGRLDMVSGTSVELVDSKGELPTEITHESLFDEELSARFGGVRRVKIVSTLVPTADEAHANRLRVRAQVEHLEAFAFARACALAGVRCAAVLSVASMVGPSGREEWRVNNDGASALAAEVTFGALKPRKKPPPPLFG
jgi:nucleoside phosphorylase